MTGGHYNQQSKPIKQERVARVTKTCPVCSTVFGPMIPGEAKRKTYCSRTCAQSVKKRYALCAYCECEFHQHKDRPKFCSRSCSGFYQGYSKRVADECDAIKRIAKSRMKKIKRVVSLQKILESLIKSMCKCSVCGVQFRRRVGFLRYCSDHCRAIGYKEVSCRSRMTEAGKAARRRAKAKRKAIERGANGADLIDPIAVFERDKWRCHICGVKTDRRLRGTSEALAPELDHIVTIADGGLHTNGNVACSCRSCNHSKGAVSLGQIGFGFI